MAYRVHAAGRSLAEPVHYDGRAETEALKARYAEWLKGKCIATVRHTLTLSLEGRVKRVCCECGGSSATYFN